jgi:hypothetical protein
LVAENAWEKWRRALRPDSKIDPPARARYFNCLFETNV